MSKEFTINPQFGSAIRTFFYSQFFGTPPYPTQSFADQTVIVTGSNIGLGFEAARHFYRLNCAKLILAVRTVSKGEAAKEDIVRSEKHRSDPDAIEIWPLDLGSTESTLAFAERVGKELARVDVVVENAGISPLDFKLREGFEETIQVNVINTFVLGLSVLPKLRETKAKLPDSSPHLVIVSSEVHHFTKFEEINAPDIYERLNTDEGFAGMERYQVSKLIEVLFIRELVSRLEAVKSDFPPVVIDLVNPGLCVSNLDGNKGIVTRLFTSFMRLIIGRSTEVGARNFVHAASAGPGSHGEFMSDGKNQDVEAWIYTDVGKRAQRKVFEQTIKVLETRKPGLVKEIGL